MHNNITWELSGSIVIKVNIQINAGIDAVDPAVAGELPNVYRVRCLAWRINIVVRKPDVILSN